MRHALGLHTLLFFSLFFCAVQQVNASRIPLGLTSKHGIFVQEFWQEGRPSLCLTNRTDTDETVQVSHWRSGKVQEDILLQWHLKAGTAQCHSVSGLEGQQLLEFTLASGARLGLFKIQRPGVVEEQPPEVGSSVFSAFKGPNGTCSTSNVWVEQSNLWFKSGEKAYVSLLTTGTDALIEFPIETRLDLPVLQIKSMASDALSIDKVDTTFTIKTKKLAVTPAVQHAQLEFDVPAVKQPTMFIVSGRQRIADNGWQCFIRGVMVEP